MLRNCSKVRFGDAAAGRRKVGSMSGVGRFFLNVGFSTEPERTPCLGELAHNHPTGSGHFDPEVLRLRHILDKGRAKADPVFMSGVTHAFISDAGTRAFSPDASPESLRYRVTRIVGIMIFRMCSENVDIVSIKVRQILAIRLGSLRQGAQRDLLAQPIGNLQKRGVGMGRAIPRSEARIRKSQTAGRSVQKRRHDDAGIRDAIHPFRAGQAREPWAYEAVVCPAFQFHDGFKVVGGGDCVKGCLLYTSPSPRD